MHSVLYPLFTNEVILDTQISNIGNGPLTVNSIELSNTDQGFFLDDPSACLTTIEAPSSCTLRVVFAPLTGSQPGEFSSTILINSNDLNEPDVTIHLTATTALGNIEVPRSFNLGDVALTESESITIPVTMTGPMRINLLEIDDPDGLYTLQHNCPLETLEATTCDAIVTFTPTETGPWNAALLIDSLDPDESLIVIHLTAQGVAFIDTDGDGVANTSDNCTLVSNAGQVDTDGDNYGNACDPDFNNDQIVNFLDFAQFGNMFNTTTALGDLNGDGAVNFIDLSIMSGYFMLPPGPSGGTTP